MQARADISNDENLNEMASQEIVESNFVMEDTGAIESFHKLILPPPPKLVYWFGEQKNPKVF